MSLASLDESQMLPSPHTAVPRHVLVTGGAGFIGTNFVYALAEQLPQTTITVLDALTYAGNRANLNDVPTDRFRFVHGDIRNVTLVRDLCAAGRTRPVDRLNNTATLLPPIDTIVHFAAESHNDNSIENAAPFLSTNIDGTYVLLEAAREFDLRFHHISTDEVYGDTAIDDTSRFNEASPYRPSSPYSASKAASDHLVRAWHRTYGVRTTISNCGNNYGPWQHIEKFIPRQISNILDGRRAKLYGTGEEVRDWIHVRDHCDAIIQILLHGTIGETYIIGASGCRSNLDVLHMILQRMGLDEHDFDHVENRPGVDRRYALDPAKIERELGWRAQFTDFGAGIDDTIAWYRTHRRWWEPAKSITERRYARQGH